MRMLASRPARGQTRALLALRWSMVRRPQVRVALVGLLAAVLAWLGLTIQVAGVMPLGAVSEGSSFLTGGVPADRTLDVLLLLPSAMLVFLVLSTIAPLVAGGGYELFPADHLVAFPVRPATVARASLLLSPLNLAWLLQVALLLTATAYAERGPYGPWLPVLVMAGYLAFATMLGQAVAWAIVGVRRRRTGRWATWAALVVAVSVALVLVSQDLWTTVLDHAPTVSVMPALEAAAGGNTSVWVPRLAVLVGLTALAYGAGVLAASWALRRSGDTGTAGPTGRPVRRRERRGSPYRELVAVDRASVWRAPPLRRGLVVIAVLPGAVAALATLSWPSIALLPPLIASGAGLLFGVNALALDGSGALWVASLPHDPALVLRAKRRVTSEVVALAAAVVVVAGAARASEPPSLTDVLCVVCGAAGCTAVVVARCMRWSVRHPYRADLRGPRDTPAPPGTMALYSVRLAVTTTFLGLLFSAGSVAGEWWFPVVLGAALAVWSWVSLRQTARDWADPHRRGDVVATVAAG